jgi:steroid Delta-isomerase
MTDEHLATTMSRRSMAAVEAGDREGWLALWSDDGTIQDPIGESPLDPSGQGHRGKEAVAAFYDTVIAPNQVRFDIHRSYPAGDEVANVGSVITTMPDGSTAIVDAVICYAVDGDGKIASLRAYWRFEDMRFEPSPG